MTAERPASVMFDTGVLLRWLDLLEKPPDPSKQVIDPAVCRELAERLIKLECTIYIAAPAMAEVVRYGGGQPIPHREDFVIVPFDQLAVELLGQHFSVDQVRPLDLKTTKNCLGFDTMIVACALANQVEHHVTLDSDQVKLCKKAQLSCPHPQELLDLISE